MASTSYRFRLEHVRALRERREEQAKLELAGALQRRRRCRDQLADTHALISRACVAQMQARGDELRVHQAYLERLESTERLLADQLTGHERDVAGRRARLTACSQERAALEKLKQKGLDAHNRELAHVEQLLLDELACNRYWRQAA